MPLDYIDPIGAMKIKDPPQKVLDFNGTQLLVKALREIGEPICKDAADEIDTLAADNARLNEQTLALVREVSTLRGRMAEAEAWISEAPHRDWCLYGNIVNPHCNCGRDAFLTPAASASGSNE